MVERVAFSYYNKKNSLQFILPAGFIYYFKELSVSGKNPVFYNMRNYIH